MPEFEKAIKIAADLSREELPEFEKAINNAANKITDFDKNYDLQSIIKMLRNDADKDSSFIASPVKLKETSYYPIPNYGSASSPFYTALCLWVGALLLISLLRVDVEVPAGIFSHYHRYFGRLLTFLSIGLMQALIVTLGNIFLLGVSIAEPLLHVLFSMFISVVFMTIVYTLVSLFNNVGKGIAIILLVLQISGAGGNFPIQVSPPFFQAIYPFLPFTYAVSLIRESVGGLYMPTVWIDMSVLAGFAILFITLGILLKKPLDKVVPKLSEKAKRSKLIQLIFFCDIITSIEGADFVANKFKTLDKMVYNLLLEKIKNGELVPNEHLAEEKLAREFGVSRSPLRKAIATLTAQGIVSYHENSGAVLNDCIVDADRYVQLMETIEIFVDAAIAKAAHFGYEMDLEKLYARMQEMERFSYLTDLENYFDAHHRFILCLISFAENPYQVRIVKQIFLSNGSFFRWN